MDYSTLINLYFERSGALQSYWTLYVVIVGGLLAFSSLRKEPDLVTTTLVTTLFCLFAYKNLGAIVEVSIQRLVILDALHSVTLLDSATLSGFAANLLNTLDPALPEHVKRFHLISDALVILTMLWMERRRGSGAK